MNQLCFCHQQPRLLLDRVSICACPHLVYTPSRAYGPMTPWDTWVPVVNPGERARLVRVAKERIGLDVPACDPLSVQDAVAAARMIHAHVLANDLEYEQWVALL
jgi:hypothetical protein